MKASDSERLPDPNHTSSTTGFNPRLEAQDRKKAWQDKQKEKQEEKEEKEKTGSQIDSM